MHALTLYIGDKNLSSWSLRAWLFLKHLQLPFEEVQWLLDAPDFKSKLTHLGVPPRVPVLKDGALVIWDSLAICEYAIEITGRGLPQALAQDITHPGVVGCTARRARPRRPVDVWRVLPRRCDVCASGAALRHGTRRSSQRTNLR